MEEPTLIEIINKLESVQIDSWKGVYRGSVYHKEKETEKISTDQNAYSAKIGSFKFTIFCGSDKYHIRVLSGSFCEWYKAERKFVGRNIEFKRLRELTHKLYDSALERETKEREIKLKNLREVLGS